MLVGACWRGVLIAREGWDGNFDGSGAGNVAAACLRRFKKYLTISSGGMQRDFSYSALECSPSSYDS
jgi:hypothetical protein